jgi:glutaredoxin 3
MPQVEIYTQDFCPFCARALQLLQSKGVEFTEIYAPRGSKEREDAISRSGGRGTVPQIFITGAHVGDCTELVALDRAGKLDPLFRAA